MGRDFRILIVDDDPDLASNLLDILEAEGYQASVAGNSQTALTLCTEKEFDLSLIDVKLPDSDGLDLVEKLTELFPAMEYIIVTGYASLDSAIQAVRRKSIVAYETKPIDVERLLSLIGQIAERRWAEEEIQQHVRQVEALHSIAHTVSQTLELDEMLGGALEKAIEAVDADMGLVLLLDVADRLFLLKAHSGIPEEVVQQLAEVRLELEEEEFQKLLQWGDHHTPLLEMLGETNLGLIAEVEEKAGAEARAIVPLWARGENYGVLAVGSHTGTEFSVDDFDLLGAIGNEIAVGIENARLLEKTREMSLIDELTGLYNRRHFYKMIDTEIARTQRYGRSFSLVMLDLDGFKEYNDRFGHVNGDSVLKSLAQALKSSLRKADVAFRHGGDEFAIILPATDADRALRIADRIRVKWLQAPKAEYTVLESPLGFSAGIAQFPENAETADVLVFLADTALLNAKRLGGYRSVTVSDLDELSPEVIHTETMDQVYALAATVDARDPYTYGHSRAVATISESLGKAIGLSPWELADLHAAALLHDVGKVGVPDSILIKPSTLTEYEWELIRRHSAEGARIVGYVRALAMAVPMIRHHHEWYNGAGYPDRLKGEDIPLGARIISIADAYDTMTTPRLYRKVVSQEEALQELRRCAGTQFDPELVEAFCRAIMETAGQG